MKILQIEIAFLLVIITTGCRQCHTKCRIVMDVDGEEAQPNTTDDELISGPRSYDETLKKDLDDTVAYFTNCLSKRTSLLVDHVEMVVNYIVRHDQWFQATKTHCSKSHNEKLCWMENRKYLLKWSSSFFTPFSDCLRRIDLAPSPPTKAPSMCTVAKGQPYVGGNVYQTLTKQRQTFSRCMNSQQDLEMSFCDLDGIRRKFDFIALTDFIMNDRRNCRNQICTLSPTTFASKLDRTLLQNSILRHPLNICMADPRAPYKDMVGDCPGRYKWTRWFNIATPSSRLGEVETVSAIRKKFRKKICKIPKAIQVQTRQRMAASTTGDYLMISPEFGMKCTNGRKLECRDYKVRFCCRKYSFRM